MQGQLTTSMPANRQGSTLRLLTSFYSRAWMTFDEKATEVLKKVTFRGAPRTAVEAMNEIEQWFVPIILHITEAKFQNKAFKNPTYHFHDEMTTKSAFF